MLVHSSPLSPPSNQAFSQPFGFCGSCTDQIIAESKMLAVVTHHNYFLCGYAVGFFWVQNFGIFFANSMNFLEKVTKPLPPPPKDPYMVQVGSKKMQGRLNSFLSYILIAKFG